MKKNKPTKSVNNYLNLPLQLLGNISPNTFMQKYWQKKHLLIKNAIPNMPTWIDPHALFQLSYEDDVESRLVTQYPSNSKKRRAQPQPWQLAHGPFTPEEIPNKTQTHWTLLVQGVNLYHPKIAKLMDQFRFIPSACLDDLMISYATDQGGVGPHIDSYDVFLLQAQGQRLWKIGKQKNNALIEGLPVRILKEFTPQYEILLNPGDMLYLPPGFAHDGIAQGECLSYSIGFRAPKHAEIASQILTRAAEQIFDEDESSNPKFWGFKSYQNKKQSATENTGYIPKELQTIAAISIRNALKDDKNIARLLGEYLTEPKPNVWFEENQNYSHVKQLNAKNLVLSNKSQMLYDDHYIFLNGNSWRALGPDAQLMRLLADNRQLHAAQIKTCSAQAKKLLLDWLEQGWLKVQ